MKFFVAVIFTMIGTAYTLPVKIEVDSLSGSPVTLIRKIRQSGFGYNNGGGDEGGYNNFDYNPYNDSPRNYDGNPFNDSTHRQLYNNFDQNPFNDSPNRYGDDYFRRRYNL